MKHTGISFLASLGVVAQIAIALLVVCALVWWAVPASRRWLALPRQMLSQWGLWIAWFVAAVATAGSLWFSEYADFLPCRLCWFQRICMYPLAAILLVGALLKDRKAVLYAAPFPVFGLGVAAYHIYIENNPSAEGGGCKIGVPCSVKWIEEFGYVTIPVLAATAFTLIGLLLITVWRGPGEVPDRGDAEAEEPSPA